MRQEPSNELRQFITPQFLTNLRLLALPNVELATLIRQEIEQSPVLEEIPPGEEEEPLPEPEENLDDFDFADFLQLEILSPPSPPNPREEPPSREREEPVAQVESPSLLDWFGPQVRQRLPPEDWMIAEYILLNLDDEGLLPTPPRELADLIRVEPERFFQILSLIQRLDPPGLAAPSRKESLLIQLEVLGFKEDSLECQIVDRCYDRILTDGVVPEQIATRLSRSDLEIKEALANIRKLDPRPARKFGRNPSYIYPDFSVEWHEGEMRSFLNDEEIPGIRIAPHYLRMLENPTGFSREEILFVHRKVKKAMLLIKGIEQRRRTLERLMEYILSKQKEFFRLGDKRHLKPLSMNEAAAALGCHPSTISRAVQAKYVETPIGIFELKFFFSQQAKESLKGDLKEWIRQLIAEEDPQNPYTDREITRLLSQKGTPIARRTVVKYRTQLGIPSSQKRRRQ